MTTQKRNTTRSQGLDLLKLFCALLIIFIHRPFPDPVGSYITAFARCAVPVFFMISGYFSPLLEERGTVWAHIRKLIVMTILINLVYMVWNIFSGDKTAVEYLTSLCTPTRIRNLLVYNISPFGAHLWYLNAIIYTTVIFEICRRLGIQKALYILTPLLLIGDLVFGKYSLLFFGREFNYMLVRNFLFVGIPNYCIGRLFRLKPRLTKVHWFAAACLSVIFTIMTCLELRNLQLTGVNATRDQYLATTLLACSLFQTFNQMPFHGSVITFLAGLGRNWSTGIYLFHPLFSGIIIYLLSAPEYAQLLVLYLKYGTLVLVAVTLIFLLIWEPIRRVGTWVRRR